MSEVLQRGNRRRRDPTHGLPSVLDMERSTLVVAGAGMVARRLVEALVERDATSRWDVEVYGEEVHAPYDRVALTSYFGLSGPEELLLGDASLWDTPGVTLHTGTPVESVDASARTVVVGGRERPYDALVLATGSYAAVPPVFWTLAAKWRHNVVLPDDSGP